MSGVTDLRLELLHVEPRVWRVLRVPRDLRLDDLHHAIQAAMGWSDFHPHVFEIGDRDYGPRAEPDDEEDEVDDGVTGSAWAGDDSELTVAQALGAAPDGFTYLYDFSEEWRVRVTNEPDSVGNPERAAAGQSEAREPGQASADGVTCLAGEHAGPQQDGRDIEPFSVAAVNLRLSRGIRHRATPEFPAGPRANADEQLLANLTLAALLLGSRVTRHGTREAWKHMRAEILESLQEAGLVEATPSGKSVTVTDAGIAHARRWLARHRKS